MLTRQKVRRKACWVGVVIGVVSLVALVMTAFGRFGILDRPGRSVSLADGAFAVYWNIGPQGIYTGGGWRWLPKWEEPASLVVGTMRSTAMGQFLIPLWVPAAFGLWCAYLLLPERAPRHQCDCGYDLSGIRPRDGKRTCPECGKSSNA